jgi:hypothetical protein
MLVAYLCGALVAAMGALAATRSSHQRTASPLTRVAPAVLVGLLWPVVVVGAVQAIGIALLVGRMKTAPDVRADEELLTTGASAQATTK